MLYSITNQVLCNYFNEFFRVIDIDMVTGIFYYIQLAVTTIEVFICFYHSFWSWWVHPVNIAICERYRYGEIRLSQFVSAIQRFMAENCTVELVTYATLSRGRSQKALQEILTNNFLLVLIFHTSKTGSVYSMEDLLKEAASQRPWQSKCWDLLLPEPVNDASSNQQWCLVDLFTFLRFASPVFPVKISWSLLKAYWWNKKQLLDMLRIFQRIHRR